MKTLILSGVETKSLSLADVSTFAAPIELKFTADATGEFEGYGAVFGNKDSHGDVILPGAFDASLAEHKAAGTMPGLYIEHGPFMGGDKLPAGVWTDVKEDTRGLYCKGRISALDTDYGRRVRSLMQDGAMKGLSIAFKVPTGGAVFGKRQGEPKRTLKTVDLKAIDIVTSPSNAEAQVHHVKSTLGLFDRDTLAQNAAAAIALHQQVLSGGNSPTADQRSALLSHLQDIHEHLTGSRMPTSMKSKPNTIRDVEAVLRESGLSHAEARAIAEHGFKSSPPRDEDGGQADVAVKSAVEDLQAFLAKF